AIGRSILSPHRPVLSRVVICASLLALAAACATPVATLPVETVRRGMLTDSQQKISTTEVLLPIRQKDIYVFATLGVAIAEGIAAGQDQATRDAAEAAAKPVRAGLAGFNFDETLQADLKSQLAQLPWL